MDSLNLSNHLLLNTIKGLSKYVGYSLYLLAFLFAFLAKLFYATATTEEMSFLLAPTTAFVELLTGLQFVSEPEGYYNASRNILIDESCSGMNFFIIAFCMTIVYSLKHYASPLHKAIFFVGSIIACYGLTIFANTSRIGGAILFHGKEDSLPIVGQGWFHQAEGIFIHFTFLLIFFFCLRAFHKSIRNYASIA